MAEGNRVVDLIIGGEETRNNEFQCYVALMIKNDLGENQLIGGATIIFYEYLITAAHCIPLLKKYPSFGVYAPSGNIRKFPMRIDFVKFITHPLYDSGRIHDIALIKIKQSFWEYNDTNIIAFLRVGDDPLREKATAIGYGRTAVDSASNDKLLKVELVITDNETSRKCYPDFFNHKIMICAGGNDNRSTFRGDSGGPLLINSGLGKYVIGIISSGPEFGAQPNMPACFTKVSAYVPWIYNEVLRNIPIYNPISYLKHKQYDLYVPKCFMVPIFESSSNKYITCATVIDDYYMISSSDKLKNSQVDDVYAMSPLGVKITFKNFNHLHFHSIIETTKSLTNRNDTLAQVETILMYNLDQKKIYCRHSSYSNLMQMLSDDVQPKNTRLELFLGICISGYSDDIEDPKTSYWSLRNNHRYYSYGSYGEEFIRKLKSHRESSTRIRSTDVAFFYERSDHKDLLLFYSDKKFVQII